MTRESMPAPDIPAVVLIVLLLFCLPPLIEAAMRWSQHVIPARIVMVGW